MANARTRTYLLLMLALHPQGCKQKSPSVVKVYCAASLHQVLTTAKQVLETRNPRLEIRLEPSGSQIAARKVAEIAQQTAGIQAETVRRLGEAEGKAIKMVEGEKASGQQLKAKAFGDPVAYSLWELAQNLNESVKINILHSGSGTLWTDLTKAGMGDLGGATIIKEATGGGAPGR